MRKKCPHVFARYDRTWRMTELEKDPTYIFAKKITTLIHPSHRRRGATAVLVRHKPQWQRPLSPWFRSDSVSDRRSNADNCQNRGPSRWHGGNVEHVQNFRSGIAAAPPQHRRGTAMTAVAPYKDRSSTSITAVPPQYTRRAIANK